MSLIASAPVPTLSTSRPFTIRRARFSDLRCAARICRLAFWDDVLFGRLIHPYRAKYPFDVDKYWYRRFVVDFWKWNDVFLVATETVDVDDSRNPSPGIATQREIITGFAHWSRIGPSRRKNYAAGWDLAWWDLRRLLSPLTSVSMRILNFFSPNRAASPTDEDIIEQSYHYLDHIWLGPRAESWYLECLAVDPAYQNQGAGRALVAWGLEQARKEGIATSVIAADGKERFYQNCGFDIGPVGRSGEGEGNPLRKAPGGLVFFKDKEGVVVEQRAPGEWMEGTGVFDWEEWERRVWKGKKVDEER
ncbi:uncharacterized protein Z518_10180 [Rhinocladiella mackenziei CBS 650.93]|uniref:N-acetyltransferase domain-containing protein n=1 Tax=Rhinocladiella mackenziei CBS 650.93 TaxID=1442369 RepID=A0A0D2I5P8_9EURO|nr:uncharacterized protein Z518_10180 [Rhinocladiella mackenziei CBS 650.93]KIX01114.1 hypothetical protein Z518_10180 [Rhinocladiella mackenziei CBS 650.93]